MIKGKYIVLIFLALSQLCHAQKHRDTAALIREFNKVMSFAVQPYLYYSSITSMRMEPAIARADSSNVLHSIFYKNKDNLYYSNEQVEIYLQDSLMIQVNHSRKTIQVSKVDVATKAKMDLLPLKKMDMQKMLREHYLITQEQGEADTSRILIRSQQKVTRGAGTTAIQVTYTRTGYLPGLMEVTMYTQQPASQQLLELLTKQGFDSKMVVQEADGSRYVLMSQAASIRFVELISTKEKAGQMPLWQNIIAYDEANRIFKGKGLYEDYEVIKTF